MDNWSHYYPEPLKGLDRVNKDIQKQYEELQNQKEKLYKKAISDFIGYEATVENVEEWSPRVHLNYYAGGLVNLLVDGIVILSVLQKGLEIFYEYTHNDPTQYKISCSDDIQDILNSEQLNYLRTRMRSEPRGDKL